MSGSSVIGLIRLPLYLARWHNSYRKQPPGWLMLATAWRKRDMASRRAWGESEMCLAKVYEAAEGDEPILEDIAYMIIDGGLVEIVTLFGERRIFKGKVRQVDFVKSKVQLEKD
jgi:predicted RNA-binding protein